MGSLRSFPTEPRGKYSATSSLTTVRIILVDVTLAEPSRTPSKVCPTKAFDRRLADGSKIDGSSSGYDRTSNSLGTTGQPAVVYLPGGTYTIKSPLQLYVGTVLMGNPLDPAIIKASSDFQGNTLIYGKDPNQGSTTNFYIGIKNLVIDSTAVNKDKSLALLDCKSITFFEPLWLVQTGSKFALLSRIS